MSGPLPHIVNSCDLWALVWAALQQTTEQMVLNLIGSVMNRPHIKLSLYAFIPEPFTLFTICSWRSCCDVEGSCHLVVKRDAKRSHVSSDLMGYTERYLSAFSTPALWNGATRIFCQPNGKAGVKRNPPGVADLSAGFHGTVAVVHVTWHLWLWGMSRTYWSMFYTQSARSL